MSSKHVPLLLVPLLMPRLGFGRGEGRLGTPRTPSPSRKRIRSRDGEGGGALEGVESSERGNGDGARSECPAGERRAAEVRAVARGDLWFAIDRGTGEGKNFRFAAPAFELGRSGATRPGWRLKEDWK